MCSCIPSKNHVKLVNSCYPTGVEKGPKQSELAYLTYYASSRPAKLLKVSAYLEKCLLRDLYKKNWDGVKVALKIFRQLTEDCEKDLNLFAKSTTRVTEKCLSESEVAWCAGTTFHDFCIHFDATTIGVDEDLTINMDCLVTKFCELACYSKENGSNQNYRLLGLYGIYSMLVSPLMKATHSKAYYTKLVYGILNNISQLDVPQTGSKEVIAWELFEPSNEKSSDESQVNLVALKCFQQLLDSSTPLNLFLIVDSVFSYITKYQLYENSQFPIDVVSFMMSTVASSYCHIIVNELLKLLNDCPMDEASHKNVALVKVVESSLNSSTASVGISVLEYLSSFVAHLRAIYRGSEAANMTVEFSPLEMDLKCGLLSAITGLGTHLYYSEQINDILAFLINKLQPVETAIPVTSFQLDLLKCMSTLTETNNKSRNDVPLPIITPTLSYLTNESIIVRNEYTRFLSGSLTPVQRNYTYTHSRNASTALADQASNLKFRSDLHNRLLDYSTKEQLTTSDYTNIFFIFKKLLDRESSDELVRALPIIFYIHRSSVEPGIVDQLLSDYLLYAGDLLKIDRLSGYSRRLIQTRKDEGLWYEEMKGSISIRSEKQYVLTEEVRDILKHEEQLKQLFPDLSERLDAIYEPGATNILEFIHSEPPKDRLVSNTKLPKLSMPILKSIDSKPASLKMAPQVEQFRDALKVKCGSSIVDDDSDSSELLANSFSTVKRSRTEISTLLKSISAHSLGSAISLVETPHMIAPSVAL